MNNKIFLEDIFSLTYVKYIFGKIFEGLIVNLSFDVN